MANANSRDPSEASRLLSNALHDLGVQLQRSNQHERALNTFDRSLNMRMTSISFRAGLPPSAGEQPVDVAKLAEERRETVREANDLREEEKVVEEENDPSRLDLFPLGNDPTSKFFLPPVPRLVEMGTSGCGGVGDVSNKTSPPPPSHNAESARTLHSMALCNLSKPRPDLDKAEQYLAMAGQVCRGSANSVTDRHPLVSADVLHARSVVSLANGRYAEAERDANDAYRLYANVAYGILLNPGPGPTDIDAAGGITGSEDGEEEEEAASIKKKRKLLRLEKRRAKECAADVLSLSIRIRHLSGRPSETINRHFRELMRLRAELHGRRSLMFAACMYNLGMVLLSSPSGLGGGLGGGGVGGSQQTMQDAWSCIEALAYHPSLLRIQRQHQQRMRAPAPMGSRTLIMRNAASEVQAEAARALDVLSRIAAGGPSSSASSVASSGKDEQAQQQQQQQDHQDQVYDEDNFDDLEAALGVKFHVHAGAA